MNRMEDSSDIMVDDPLATKAPDLEENEDDIDLNADAPPIPTSDPISEPHTPEENEKVSNEAPRSENLGVTVQVPSAIKDGDIVTFKLVVKKSDITLEIQRQFDDFEFLHHTLKCEVKENGIIFPPLPPAPLVDPKQVMRATKEIYGNDTSLVLPEDYVVECQKIEKYIKLVVNHPVIGQCTCLRQFLLERVAPPRTKVKPGAMSSLSSAFGRLKLGSQKDVDEFFETERITQADYLATIKSASDQYHRTLTAQFKLSSAETYLASVLTQGNVYGADNPVTPKELELMGRIADLYKDESHVNEVSGNNGLGSLARTLDLMTSYYESAKETMQARTAMMVDYQTASKTLTTTKPQKITEAMIESKKKKEEDLEECSKMLKIELEGFGKFRVEEMARCLTKYSNIQLTSAVDRHALLMKHLNQIKNMSI